MAQVRIPASRKALAAIVTAILGLFVIPSFAEAQTECNGEASRYTIEGSTVYDKLTDRTWSRCSVGQQWREDEGCVGPVRKVRFDEAEAFQYADWRLPTVQELKSLIPASCARKPKIDTAAFPGMDGQAPWYWSASHGSLIWFVSFDDGHVSSCRHGDSRVPMHAVRLIKDGNWNDGRSTTPN